MDYVQKVEEELCQLAIDAKPDRKVSAEVMRDLMIQVVRAHSIEDPKKRQEILTDILSAMCKSMGLALFLATPREDIWKTAIRVLQITVFKSAKNFMSDFQEFKAGRRDMP
jgi:hypothetical protein